MQVRVNGVGVYTSHGVYVTVLSDSGSTYHLTFQSRPEFMNEDVALWECDCPAGLHGKPCKHIRNMPAYEDYLIAEHEPAYVA